MKLTIDFVNSKRVTIEANSAKVTEFEGWLNGTGSAVFTINVGYDYKITRWAIQGYQVS
ncbi:hypothetical protein QUG28_06195 [Bacillus hominis]|uniref:hypothetical protein n=1 Tax=Bacillus hominis TaxID=2817478 RepID=UPI0025A2EB1B|nr:hypothetical protein [Bacillus hominis]MDM5432360.1 hypothetical protein [Bacillus hominis]